MPNPARVSRLRLPGLVLSCAVFCVWVAVCAAAPEFLWAGLQIVLHHAGTTTLWWGLLFGAILAFFIEPIFERIRHGGRYADERGPAAAAAAAVFSALTAVAVHEVLIAMAVASHGKPQEEAALYDAINLVLEAALIPLGITAAWFTARIGTIAAIIGAVLAGAWFGYVWWLYGWGLRVGLTTAIPVAVILVTGQIWEARDPGPVRRLMPLVAGVGTAWLIIAWLVQQLGWAETYPGESLRIDAFFFAGWCLGLVLAPEPLERPAGTA